MWSTFSSLYLGLGQDTATSLAEYVRLVRIGKFTAANQLFDSSLAVHQHVPLVCVERALGLFYQGRNAASLAFVGEALGNNNLDSDQRMLLCMIERLTTIMARGAMFPALCRVRQLRESLKSVPWNDFSLYQVRQPILMRFTY